MNVNGISLDAESSPSVGATIDRQTHMSNADVANDYNSGMSAGRGLLKQDNGFNSGLSYGDKATSDAIRSRYMPHYNMQENQLKLENVKNAQTDHLRNLQVATEAAGQEVELNKQKAILRNKIEQAEKAARGAILGQTLGIVGAVVGAVAGSYGGATVQGGAAGYAAGQGLGNAMGGG